MTETVVHLMAGSETEAGKPSLSRHTHSSTSVETSIKLLLQSLGIPCHIDTVKKCIQAVATTSAVTATPINICGNSAASAVTNKSTTIPIIQYPLQGLPQLRVTTSQGGSLPPNSVQSKSVTVCNKTHTANSSTRSQVVGGTTQHSKAVVVPSSIPRLRQSSQQPLLSQPPADRLVANIHTHTPIHQLPSHLPPTHLHPHPHAPTSLPPHTHTPTHVHTHPHTIYMHIQREGEGQKQKREKT